MLTCHLSRSVHTVKNIYFKASSRNLFLVTFLAETKSKNISHYRPLNTSVMATLENLRFDNLALKNLPIDKEGENFTRSVSGACFSLVKPTSVDNPQTVVYSKPAMKLLDLPEEELDRKDFAEYFSGNKILPGSETASHCYCGHQFGHFSGQLGDGAAIYLGEVMNSKGERWEIQLKGAGKTPYSRHADGRKVLRSSIREFLCSEAMHSLGIPTTRAGSCVTSDSTVIRDIFYSGNAIHEKCTIVLRLAPTFIRFGSFEIFKPIDAETGRQGPSVGRTDILETLLQYVIETFYPEIWEIHKGNKEDAYVAFYQEIVHRTARLVAQWQGVGFCHGVLNTDNMSIVGVTIDYGPYGFMDKYDPTFICNASDDGGRYTYEKQPEICKWNCMKLAESLQPLVAMEKLRPILETYDEVYEEAYMGIMRRKLGLLKQSTSDDKALVEDLFKAMAETGADFTNIFRGLSKLPLPSMPEFKVKLEEVKAHFLSQCCTMEELRAYWRPRMDPRQLSTLITLMQMNPDLLAQLGVGHRGISQELDRVEKTKELKDATDAEKTSKDTAQWSAWLEKYADRLRMEETGGGDLDTINTERVKVMNETNPRVVLRNYIAQSAIEKAEKGDYSEVRRLLKVLEQPYCEEQDVEGLQGGVADLSVHDSETAAATSSAENTSSFVEAYDKKPPKWAADLRVT